MCKCVKKNPKTVFKVRLQLECVIIMFLQASTFPHALLVSVERVSERWCYTPLKSQELLELSLPTKPELGYSAE